MKRVRTVSTISRIRLMVPAANFDSTMFHSLIIQENGLKVNLFRVSHSFRSLFSISLPVQPCWKSILGEFKNARAKNDTPFLPLLYVLVILSRAQLIYS